MEPLKSGWEYAGGNQSMVKNTATGQVTDIYHPDYLKSTAPAPAGSTSTAPGAPEAPQNAQQALTQAPQSGAPTTVSGAFQQALLGQLNQGPVTAASPQVAPAIQANQLAEQRGYDRNRALLAERNAAQGLSMSGGNESMIRGLQQDRSLRESQFAGNAVMDANKVQAQQVMAALGLTGGLLGDQDRLAMQKYIADLNATLSREGLSTQSALGGRELDIRDKLGSGNLNLGLLGLLQGGEQFGQNLGANLGMFSANMNQNALLSLLGGGL
jgi:hypothetical protein